MKLKEILDKRLDLSLELIDLENELRFLNEDLKHLFLDMEEEAEPEGGPICDQYADAIRSKEIAITGCEIRISKKEKQLEKLNQL